MADADPNKTAIVDAAVAYIGAGFRLVQLKPGSKQPVSEKGWQNANPAGREFEGGKNIGVQLGAKSGHLVDLDLDCEEARHLAGLECFFGHLPAFRRASLPTSAPGHRLVVCDDAPDMVMKFSFERQTEQAAIADLGLDKSVILELRAGKGYTVFPPSVIAGDPLVWNGRATADVPTMAWEELRLLAGILAFASFAAACYPPEGGRDNFCLHLAGALIHCGVEAETAEDIIAAIATMKGDNPRDRRGKAIATAAKRDAGEPVTGIPAFLTHIGMQACVKRVRDWLGIASPDLGEPVPADAILIGRPDTHAMLAEIEAMFIAKSGRVFRRGSELVRVSTLEEPEESPEEGVYRKAGLVELRVASPAWLAIEASRVGSFAQRSGNKVVSVAPSPSLMGMLGAVADESHFPPVRGLSLTPTLRCERPGYDPDSQLFLAFPEGMFPPGKMEPTREEAEAALARLVHPLRGFPFVADADRSVALSGMIAAVIRGEMRTCPLHMIDAPSRGTGKTKLAEIIGIMGTGVAPSGVTHNEDGDENEKRLVAILRTGDPVILIDNVSTELEGDFLCTMLTSETVQARILGQSERIRLSTRADAGDGQQHPYAGDMARRAVRCRLDAHMANPEERPFDFDAVADVREARPALVMDALTVVRAYVAAGQPVIVTPFGSFEDWDLVRGALVWLGHADPADTRAAVKDDDADVEEKVELLWLLYDNIGIGAPFTMAELGARHADDTLRVALCRMLERGMWDSKRAGRLFLRHRDVPFLGLTLRSRPNRAKVQEWWLEGEAEAALLDYRRSAPCPF